MAFLSRNELESIGFSSVGKNVLISERAAFYNPSNIAIASNVRIDDFCVISAGIGGICIGNYIHISVYASLMGRGRIVLEDYSTISSRVAIYSSNDDYSGVGMTNPMVPEQFTRVTHGDVIVKKHVIVGANSVILPGVVLEEGVAIGALSLIKKTCAPFTIYSGNPAIEIGRRSRFLLDKERDLLSLLIDEKPE